MSTWQITAFEKQPIRDKWEHNEAVHQVFLYFKTAYDSAGIEVMCKILIENKVSKKYVECMRYPVVLV